MKLSYIRDKIVNKIKTQEMKISRQKLDENNNFHNNSCKYNVIFFKFVYISRLITKKYYLFSFQTSVVEFSSL